MSDLLFRELLSSFEFPVDEVGTLGVVDCGSEILTGSACVVGLKGKSLLKLIHQSLESWVRVDEWAVEFWPGVDC